MYLNINGESAARSTYPVNYTYIAFCIACMIHGLLKFYFELNRSTLIKLYVHWSESALPGEKIYIFRLNLDTKQLGISIAEVSFNISLSVNLSDLLCELFACSPLCIMTLYRV